MSTFNFLFSAKPPKQESGMIMHNERIIKYSIQRSSKRRSIALGIDLHNGLKINAPHKATTKTVEDIIRKKIKWIIRHLQSHEELKKMLPTHNFVNAESFLYLGSSITLKVIDDPYCKRVRSSIEKDILTIVMPNVAEPIKREHTRKALISWYRKCAEEIVTSRTEKYAGLLGISFYRIAIREQKKIWGSCSFKGIIRINWKIVMAPISVVDYVVVHELCHIKIRNHSSNFWDLVASILPDYRERRLVLKKEGIKFTL
ncbi:MAG: hypothetical protein DKM50_00180 [Candidatus Margulisiibacteriota bacterium]|nr:MAG: hypothetical protein A2X43_02680 [Candidatus Margulisbacteria bacterium GWD2_39_127]OGI02739.1 MAG: hypothetical protein A2X42_01715 [Candidatus Margulisbacteria bacterium GWF2_38_17]OGI09375.1 MAG: hypothetical protein A2X41_09660 [Candidatus Margulisbacteria bacterium GWE2_39_32]PZM84952.1 MAG: hypothetical protein DKM50_00180 [Candidatus Margulisiibacteriota bacterium]HAR63641.1 hypothetical protein [Candidatus Margulisiibacteriota bacterium]